MTIGEIQSRPQRRLRAVQGEPTVSVVIPAKNEAQNLPHVFSGLPVGQYEIILVDGNSTDETVNVTRELRPEVGRLGAAKAMRLPADSQSLRATSS
jgi:cellulose synthase/poly-beta-1,6-N-acetylglucosamine synthase-like glycosyltransferase